MNGYKCSKCGYIYTAKRLICSRCRSRNFEEIGMGDKCKLIAHTILYVTPEGVDISPLPLGIVEFPNGGRAFGQILTDNPQDGMSLKPVWKVLRRTDDTTISGYAFEQI